MVIEKKPTIVLDYDGELIGEVKRNDYEDTRVYVRESKKGGHYVEIRRWKHVKTYDGPSSKGVGLHQDEVEGVVELLKSACIKAESIDSEVTASVSVGDE